MTSDGDQNEKSKLPVVSAADAAAMARLDREEQDLQRRRAEEQLGRPLKKLAANVLRIVRGAGKPHELLKDCVDVVKAANAYIDAHDCGPSSFLIQEKMKFEVKKDGRTEYYQEQLWAMETMTKGALQYAASVMMDQRAQTCAGEYEMIRGAREHERLIAEQSARWAARAAAAKLPRKPRKTASRKKSE